LIIFGLSKPEEPPEKALKSLIEPAFMSNRGSARVGAFFMGLALMLFMLSICGAHRKHGFLKLR
jgi:hypothetical protein